MNQPPNAAITRKSPDDTSEMGAMMEEHNPERAEAVGRASDRMGVEQQVIQAMRNVSLLSPSMAVADFAGLNESPVLQREVMAARVQAAQQRLREIDVRRRLQSLASANLMSPSSSYLQQGGSLLDTPSPVYSRRMEMPGQRYNHGLHHSAPAYLPSTPSITGVSNLSTGSSSSRSLGLQRLQQAGLRSGYNGPISLSSLPPPPLAQFNDGQFAQGNTGRSRAMSLQDEADELRRFGSLTLTPNVRDQLTQYPSPSREQVHAARVFAAQARSDAIDHLRRMQQPTHAAAAAASMPPPSSFFGVSSPRRRLQQQDNTASTILPTSREQEQQQQQQRQQLLRHLMQCPPSAGAAVRGALPWIQPNERIAEVLPGRLSLHHGSAPWALSDTVTAALLQQEGQDQLQQQHQLQHQRIDDSATDEKSSDEKGGDTHQGGTFIEEVTELDVLCGRGARSNHWPGNRRYRRVVSEMKESQSFFGSQARALGCTVMM